MSELKTIHDELYVDQYLDEETRCVTISLDGEGENQVELQFIINNEGEYELRCMSAGGSFCPSYYFSKVSEHVRVTEVSEHCNMIPPDFKVFDPIGMTPTEPNEGFRHSGIKDFKSKYEWSRGEQDWVIKEEE